MRSSIIIGSFAALATTAVAQSTTTPFPAGSTLANGGYVCNPAHAYPAGQSCDGSNGGLPTLVTKSVAATTAAASTTSAADWAAAGWATYGSASTTASVPVSKYTGAAAAVQVPALGALALGMMAFLA